MGPATSLEALDGVVGVLQGSDCRFGTRNELRGKKVVLDSNARDLYRVRGAGTDTEQVNGRNVEYAESEPQREEATW